MAVHERVRDFYHKELIELKYADLFKEERLIHSPQGADISVEYPANADVSRVINFCANNYLGLSSHPEVLAAAKKALDERGFGLSSGAIHLRNTGPAQRARKEGLRVPGNGRCYSLLLVL